MIDILSVENMRKSDAATIEAGTSGRELMMRAAKGIFESTSWAAPVAIVCGSGNNAGDGYALALLLSEAGTDCTVFCVYDRFSEDGRYYHDKCREAGIDIRTDFSNEDICNGYATIVDGLLGTGFKGHLRPELSSVIDSINSSRASVVSIDINSGLNGDTGMCENCVRSDLTVSVGGFKPGHFLNMAKDVIKDKVNIDIGIRAQDPPYNLIEKTDIPQILGERPNHSNKGTYGYTALIGGSIRYSGAIRLAYMANAAMRSGAGVVKVALPSSLVHDITSHILESTIFPLSDDNGAVSYVATEIDELISNVRTVAFGMGIGTDKGAGKILEHLITGYKGKLIIDADGLTLLSGLERNVIKQREGVTILTPHIKEFSRLTGMDIDEILASPVENARAYAKETNTVVLLKGASTIVTDGVRVYITDSGCPGMATAGSGDVLSGILAAVCSYVKDPCLAVAAGAYINGAAGELASSEYGDISMIASDTVAAIPHIISPD